MFPSGHSPLFLRVLAFGSAVALLGAALMPLQGAIDSPDQNKLSLQELEGFRTSGIPDEQWPALLETLGQTDFRAAVLSLVKDQQPFPAAKLVPHLTHPKLAVRLGALDLLEDVAGETFGFDPWLAAPSE